MDEYDIQEAFRRIELELISSMKRNLQKHRDWETDEDMNWTMWQAEQLKSLEKFKKENKKIFSKQFKEINTQIEALLQDTYKMSGFDQERKILETIKNNKSLKELSKQGIEGSFFKLNTKKMNALMNSVMKDMQTAETAMLRMTNDQYRKTIFNAQVYMNSGAGTLKKAIDMAMHDFLSAGINCIQYKDGRRVNIASYAEMAIRTANKRAVLISEGDVRKQMGIHTVRISKYGQCSETCLPWQGRVYVDDVYSGGTVEEAKELKLPLLSEAIAGGLFHPNCKHRANTYYLDLDDDASENEVEKMPKESPVEEQEHRKNQLHIQQQKRLVAGSLDGKNIEKAEMKLELWEEKDEHLLLDHPELEIPSFMRRNKINAIENSDEVVEQYFNKLELKTNDKKVIEYVKNDLKRMPEKDLQLLDKFHLSLESNDKISYYVSPNKIGKLFGLKRKIYMNVYEGKFQGSFAHEFAHFAADVSNLYEDSEFIKVLDNVFSDCSIKIKKIHDKDEIYVVSERFIREYQGRTYLSLKEFNKKGLNYNDLKEYVSVGYQTFITDPILLERKDKMLYDYFIKRGLR